jgi:hypothetical protein
MVSASHRRTRARFGVTRSATAHPSRVPERPPSPPLRVAPNAGSLSLSRRRGTAVAAFRKHDRLPAAGAHRLPGGQHRNVMHPERQICVRRATSPTGWANRG